MKKVANTVLSVLGLGLAVVISAISYLVLALSTAFVMPVARGWHEGRLAAERAAQRHEAAEIAGLMAKLGVSEGVAKESSLGGQYL